MLKNRITTTDLKRYDSSIEKYLSRDLVDWQAQINEAYELVKDKLRARDIDIRILGTPLDLNRPLTTTTEQDALISLTKTTTYTSTHIEGVSGFNRFVVNVTAMNGASGYSFALQGSNDLSVSSTVEPVNWTTISTILPFEVKEYSLPFQDEYRSYRIVLTITAGSPTITFTASIVETYIDRFIIWQALSLIYQMISKSPDDGWMRKSDNAMINFQTAFDTYKFAEDTDEDNLITDSDELEEAGTITMVR